MRTELGLLNDKFFFQIKGVVVCVGDDLRKDYLVEEIQVHVR